MPSRSRVEAFIAMVESEDHVAAIENFYHPDATMQENGLPPRVGRDTLMERERKTLARIARVHTHKVTTFLVDGDNVAVRWTFDFTERDGITRRLEELALQHWRGDRIQTERFFYDTATAWQVVEP